MYNKVLDMLEYNVILEQVSGFASTYIGKDKILNLLPSNSFDEVNKLICETNEAYSMIKRFGNAPLDSIEDVGISLKLLISSHVLSCKDLLDLSKILKLSRLLNSYFYNDNVVTEDYPNLEPYFEGLYSNLDIENTITSKIIDETTIDDRASTGLYSIRRKLKSVELNIKEKLNSFIHSSTYSKFIQEPVVTIRNNRYVIPVKDEYRSNIKGFIHDVSSSGATVFIEPMAVFEMNNELADLHLKESKEIQEILLSLTNLLVPIVENIEKDLTLIEDLDFIFARAKYSIHINATMPILNQNKKINLINAKHPLIDKDTVVPISLELGTDYKTLVITGPNTGGKTVTLKTIGLLCLMTYSGLFIPADENSSIHVFENVFANIGDEQSIEASLSTFSSHMVNIIQILNNLSDNSLVLLDELGSGTDPIEGSSLAISILETLFNSNCLTICTTHYPEIKNYALVTSGFENASCEFDIENLKPTYKLLIGIPGKSNAFAISRRLGLDNKILDRANHFMKESDISIEELLKSIYDDKIEIEKEKEATQKNLNQIELLRKSLEKDNSDLTEKRNKIIEDAKIEARNILLNAKEQVSTAISEISKACNSNTSIKDLNNIRNTINDEIKNTLSINVEPISSNDCEEIKKGDTVFVTTLNQNGTVQSNPDKSGNVIVLIGSTKLTLNCSLLKLVKDVKNNTTSNYNVKQSFKSKTATTEINVIGYNVEEAIFAVDKFLDDSSLAKLSSVRIVHGKGTGTLRAGIHTFLMKHPHEKSFRLGTFGEGETGVTVVELK